MLVAALSCWGAGFSLAWVSEKPDNLPLVLWYPMQLNIFGRVFFFMHLATK